MKNIKRIIAFALTFALMTTVLCFTAFASNETEDKYADLRAAVDAKCHSHDLNTSTYSKHWNLPVVCQPDQLKLWKVALRIY